MIQKAKTISYDARARAFWVLVIGSVLLIATYIVAIEMTVHNTVARETLQNQDTALATVVSQLEFQDIALKNNIDLNLAYAQGFKDVTAPVYISRAAAGSLSMNVSTAVGAH